MVLLCEIVVPRIAANWNMMADCLEFGDEDKRLIGEKCQYDPVKCCEQLLENWLSGDKGVSPKSWSKLIEVLKEIRCLRGAAEKILKELEEAGVLTACNVKIIV